jgi:hypothetical protein
MINDQLRVLRHSSHITRLNGRFGREFPSLGLLNGATGTCYGRLDSFKEEFDWLSNDGVFWQAAKNDSVAQKIRVDDYLTKVKAAIRSFRTDGKVFDHEELRNELLECAQIRDIRLLVGGKSVGKSTILKQMVEELNNREDVLVLYVSGREYPGEFSKGVVAALKRLDEKFKLADRDWQSIFSQVCMSEVAGASVKATPGTEAKIGVAAISCGASFLNHISAKEDGKELKFIEIFIE